MEMGNVAQWVVIALAIGVNLVAVTWRAAKSPTYDEVSRMIHDRTSDSLVRLEKGLDDVRNDIKELLGRKS